MRRRIKKTESKDIDDNKNSSENDINDSEIDNRDEHLLEMYNTTKSLVSDSMEVVENLINNDNTDKNNSAHKRKEARIYKRWIFITSVLTFVIAWILFTLFFDYRPNIDFSKFSEVFFEREIFAGIPGGTIFGDQFRAKLTKFIKPFTNSNSVGSEDEEGRSPGKQLKRKGAKAHFPVVLIPGVTSTGLEIWEGKICARSLFRQRLWGTLTMLRTLLMDKECWIEHLRLDPRTGKDPEGIRMRAAQGLEAADFILPGFWVWARIISNLAEIGYDHNNLHMAAYDWRLDLGSLEVRDRYFSKLKSQIELMHKSQGRKVLLIGHSLGSQVWIYFQKWVESDPKKSLDNIGGGGSSNWIDQHVEAFVNIAGPLLGAPKSISAILSGETKDTAQMGTLESYILELLLNKQERLSLFRTWMGGFAIFPKGGSRIWGSSTKGSPDIPIGAEKDFKGFEIVTVNPPSKNANGTATNSAPVEKVLFGFDDLKKIHEISLPTIVKDRYELHYSDGIAHPSEIEKNDLDHRKWVNPLESRLPFAPKMKIYCMYGTGHETERAYIYKARYPDETSKFTKESVDPRDLLLPMSIDLQEENRANGLYKGVYHVDGDATVPLVSLSYMCTHAWPNFTHLNPSGIKIITREFKHAPSNRVTDLRGGPGTSDHVDILGNHDLTLDILKIASNFREDDSQDSESSILEDRIFSNIREINSKGTPKLAWFMRISLLTIPSKTHPLRLYSTIKSTEPKVKTNRLLKLKSAFNWSVALNIFNSFKFVDIRFKSKEEAQRTKIETTTNELRSPQDSRKIDSSPSSELLFFPMPQIIRSKFEKFNEIELNGAETITRKKGSEIASLHQFLPEVSFMKQVIEFRKNIKSKLNSNIKKNTPVGVKSIINRLIKVFKEDKKEYNNLISNEKSINLGRKVVILGFHGWFPNRLIQKVIGDPRRTSSRIVDMFEVAILDDEPLPPFIEGPASIYKFALQSEGTIEERVNKHFDELQKVPLDYVHEGLTSIQHLQEADTIVLGAHSQGAPVAIILLAKLLDSGLINPKKQNITVLTVSGIFHGPFPPLRKNLVVQYVEADAARQLFDLNDPNSHVSNLLAKSLDRILQSGINLTCVASWLDQVVPFYSACLLGFEHPNIWRSIHINADHYRPDFLTKLVNFGLKIKNISPELGEPETHMILAQVSDYIAGSIYQHSAHSSAYRKPEAYKTALDWMRLGPGTKNVPIQPIDHIRHRPLQSTVNSYYLPWLFRGWLKNSDLLDNQLLTGEIHEMQEMYKKWKPESKLLKEFKIKLEPLTLLSKL